MLKILGVLLVSVGSFIFFACSAWLGDSDGGSSGNGSINVAIALEAPSGRTSENGVRSTNHNRVFLLVLSEKDEIVRDTTVTTSGSLVLCGFANIPAETEYRIVAWTQDLGDVVIHSPDTQSVFVQTNLNSNVILTLQPRVGSIVAQFASVPTTISGFFMSFASDSGLFESTAPRAVNTYISLDKVPYGASGTLIVRAIRTDGSFHIDWDTLFTFRRENIYLELSFLQNDAMQAKVHIVSPYNTVFTGFVDIENPLEEEKNRGVLITEFCVNAANNADFVEVANLSDKPLYFEELRLTAIGSSRLSVTATNVALYPDETFVFGNVTSPDYWDNIDVTGGLALVSTTAILTLHGNGEMLDYVIYFNNNANSGWPSTSSSGRTSWELKELVADPKHNNFGGKWTLSTSVGLIDEQGRAWYGSPGVLR